MPKSENRVTVIRIVRHLQNELGRLVALDSLNVDQEYQLISIGRTVEVLMQVAEDVNDRQFYDILDDFEYGVNETSMGAPSKAAYELAKTEAKIQELERTYIEE